MSRPACQDGTSGLPRIMADLLVRAPATHARTRAERADVALCYFLIYSHVHNRMPPARHMPARGWTIRRQDNRGPMYDAVVCLAEKAGFDVLDDATFDSLNRHGSALS
ncbi:hypothetical protein Q5752_004139 [Cryptotrichosporon argae]